MNFDLPQSELTLIAELERAASMLARIRGFLDQFPADTLENYERTQQLPSYRALRRDEQSYQSLWLRLHARILQLHKHDHSKAEASLRRLDLERNQALRSFDLDLRAHANEFRERRQLEDKVPPFLPSACNEPIRQVIGSAPGRNEPCPCGSGQKYKRCCGNTLAPNLTKAA